jgi:pimeloyl-ACP methyl ester carboxylesterase
MHAASLTMMNPFVLCVHSFAGSSRQYRGLGAFTLAVEAAPLEALLPRNGPLHLVGHSYGAAVALRIAANHRDRVRAMALYEPASPARLPRRPRAEVVELDGLPHMGPVTHPERVDPLIEAFIAAQ